MKRLGVLALVLSALALTMLLSAPRNAAATTCTCLTTIHQTPTENAKSAVSCTEAKSKLYNKLVLDEACNICYESAVTYTTACYYDPADLHYHVSGYLQYRCLLGCDPNP